MFGQPSVSEQRCVQSLHPPSKHTSCFSSSTGPTLRKCTSRLSPAAADLPTKWRENSAALCQWGYAKALALDVPGGFLIKGDHGLWGTKMGHASHLKYNSHSGSESWVQERPCDFPMARVFFSFSYHPLQSSQKPKTLSSHAQSHFHEPDPTCVYYFWKYICIHTHTHIYNIIIKIIMIMIW